MHSANRRIAVVPCTLEDIKRVNNEQDFYGSSIALTMGSLSRSLLASLIVCLIPQ